MEWVNINTKVPPESGPYVVSVHWQRSNGISVFKYVAHYNKEDNTWYKYDPFSDEKPSEEIKGEVTAWGDKTSVFLKS